MFSASARIGDWLGVEPPLTEAAVLGIIEQQLEPPVIQRLQEMGLSREEIHTIIIPARTLQHRRSRRERLTVEESDRVIRALRVISAAEGVYESRERALAWLRRPNPRLSNRQPISLLKTDTGARIVEELLGQIDEGYFI
jgi:putative toxin-antitoxin system antitoxin component (TIGR02293 family)